MSFDQDPNEQANISGADLAMMVDEIKSLQQQLAEASKDAGRFQWIKQNWSSEEVWDIFYECYVELSLTQDQFESVIDAAMQGSAT